MLAGFIFFFSSVIFFSVAARSVKVKRGWISQSSSLSRNLMKLHASGGWNQLSKETRLPSKSSKILTNLKEKHHPRSFQNPLNAQTATDHTIHQSTNLDHAMDVIESTTAEENVKRNIGRQKERNPHKENCNKNKQNKSQTFFSGPDWILNLEQKMNIFYIMYDVRVVYFSSSRCRFHN